jgi:hypothetical protein
MQIPNIFGKGTFTSVFMTASCWVLSEPSGIQFRSNIILPHMRKLSKWSVPYRGSRLHGNLYYTSKRH